MMIAEYGKTDVFRLFNRARQSGSVDLIDRLIDYGIPDNERSNV